MITPSDPKPRPVRLKTEVFTDENGDVVTDQNGEAVLATMDEESDDDIGEAVEQRS